MSKRSDPRPEAAPSDSHQNSQYIHQPTKLERVLSYLITEREITQVEAYHHCSCWRLSAVIHTLKKAGIQIETRQEAHDGGYHSCYWLPGHSLRPAQLHLERLQKKGVRDAVV